MRRAETFAQARDAAREVAGPGGRIGLVPTLGYWHEGHIALAERAASEVDAVVATIFVNPLQFDEAADLAAYPRTVERDAALAAEAGVDVLLVPSLDEMFPEPASTRVSVEALTVSLEGAFRPGHFEGVATVVTKLFAGAQPDVAYFGRKDAQQLAVVRRLVRDLSFPIRIAPVSTVREFDGLALSSRNALLTPAGRSAAVALSTGLMKAADAIEAGERAPDILAGIAWQAMDFAPGVEPDYASVVDAHDVIDLIRVDRTCFLAVAARVGEVRLIDNLYIDVDGEVVRPDRGKWLERPSVVYREEG